MFASYCSTTPFLHLCSYRLHRSDIKKIDGIPLGSWNDYRQVAVMIIYFVRKMKISLVMVYTSGLTLMLRRESYLVLSNKNTVDVRQSV